MVSYGATRAVLAYSTFVFGYTFFSEKKVYKQILGIFIVFLSWKAHSSMILPIVLTPFTFLKVTKTRMYSLLAFFPVVVILFNQYSEVFLGSSTIQDSISVDKFNTYNEGGYATEVSTTTEILRFVFGFVLVLPVYYGMKGIYTYTLDERFHKICKLSFLMVYMSFVIYFSKLDNITFFNRYFTMVPFFLYIAMSGIAQVKSLTPHKRKIYISFVLAYASVVLLYNLYCNYFV